MDTISKDVLTGEIMIDCTFSRFVIRLDSNMTYQSFNFSCVEKTKLTGGNWSIFNDRMLELKSVKGRKLYDIIQYDSYYFFIELADRRKFISKLYNEIKIRSEYKNDDKHFPGNFAIAKSLNTEYLAKQPPGSRTR